jgi:RNA polymerase sigma factor (sigma-70 family)
MSSPKIDGDGHYLRPFVQELRADEPEAARQGGAAPAESVVSPKGDPYLEDIAERCMACKREVERLISPMARNPALVTYIADQAVQRVVMYAGRHRGEKEIGSVKGLLLVAARNLLKDAQSKKLKADKVETVSWDDEVNAGLLNRADDSPAEAILKRIEAADLKGVALGVATDDEKEIFRLWFDEDMAPAEIARQLEVCSATVKHRLDRLFAKVRSALKSQS